MRRLPPLNALRAFEAAARHGSFAAAAEELAVTPTAISHQIRALEGYLGRTLFRRRPRPIALTDAGRQLYPVLRDGFDRFAAAMNAMQFPADSAPLIVTTTPAFATWWLLPRLGTLRSHLGDVTLEVRASERPLDLRAGGADFAVRYAARPTEDLVWDELFRDRYVPVAAPAFLPPGRSALSQAELARQPLIHYEWQRPSPLAPSWDRWFATERPASVPAAAPGRALFFSDESHALQAAIAGHGVALASNVLMASALAAGELVQAHEHTLEGFAFHAVHLPESQRSALIRRFVAWARRNPNGPGKSSADQ